MGNNLTWGSHDFSIVLRPSLSLFPPLSLSLHFFLSFSLIPVRQRWIFSLGGFRLCYGCSIHKPSPNEFASHIYSLPLPPPLSFYSSPSLSVFLQLSLPDMTSSIAFCPLLLSTPGPEGELNPLDTPRLTCACMCKACTCIHAHVI